MCKTWRRTLSYWQRRNISGPRPVPFYGNTYSLALKPGPVVELEWYKKYGKLFGVYNMSKPALTVAEPSLVKQVLVKEFHRFCNRSEAGGGHPVVEKNLFNARDEHWKRIRAIASPVFTSGKLKRMLKLINGCARDMTSSLNGQMGADGLCELDIKQMMGAFTMDVIASTAFATKINTYGDPNNRFTACARNIFNSSALSSLVLATLPKWPIVVWIRRWLGFGNAADANFIIDFSRQLIAKRKRLAEKHDDFVQLLIDVERVDTNNNPNTSPDSKGTDVGAHHLMDSSSADELTAERQALAGVVSTAKKLTTDEILAQCFLFILGGYETTSNTLAFCAYELALNPGIQDRLREEISDAAVDHTGDIDYETLSRLPLLDAVVSETLRKYPPLVRVEREAMEDVVLTDDTLGLSVRVEKGVYAEIPVYAIHHDPDYFPDPFAFRPDRFLPKNRHNIKPYTYMPFGAGPRNCLGMRFALFQTKLAMVKLIKQFYFYQVSNTNVPIVFNKRRGLVQGQSIIVGVGRK
ncbi:unnamed protein product [Medioppia subpectinata]|uniref:Cytochrome P450 n=1 Tax=Medioppia subpectinata TaxID=1979941 RepID=A0A7R9L5N6_9ACAR|nr:unnamed protein product [Medioppia subpectinata]CAG2114850.1 unnamed protein product [Medioppia subpectinata]